MALKRKSPEAIGDDVPQKRLKPGMLKHPNDVVARN